MNSTDGGDLWRRMTTVGITKSEFAERAGIDRATLQRVLDDDPKVRDATRAKVDRTIDALEDEIGMALGGHMLSATVEFDGMKVTLRGTPDEVAATVRQLRNDRPTQPTAG